MVLLQADPKKQSILGRVSVEFQKEDDEGKRGGHVERLGPSRTVTQRESGTGYSSKTKESTG
jgi:hypothetical protein